MTINLTIINLYINIFLSSIRRKRRIVDERKNSGEWNEKYFFIVQNKKILCFICRKVVVVKEYNVKRYHETNYEKFHREA